MTSSQIRPKNVVTFSVALYHLSSKAVSPLTGDLFTVPLQCFLESSSLTAIISLPTREITSKGQSVLGPLYTLQKSYTTTSHGHTVSFLGTCFTCKNMNQWAITPSTTASASMSTAGYLDSEGFN